MKNAQEPKLAGKCGLLALLLMLLSGSVFGLCGVILAHVLMTFYPDYTLILIFPVLMAVFIGFGCSLGAQFGRCSALNVLVALVLLIFVSGCYGVLLFLNDYHASQDPKPLTVVDEYALLAEDIQNSLSHLPLLADYILPVPDTKRAEQHFAQSLLAFVHKLPELAQRQPVVIGKIFNLGLFTPVRDYLIAPGFTEWQVEEGQGGQLVFSPVGPVQPWMVWFAEILLVYLITLFMTRGGTKRAYRKYVDRLNQAGMPVKTSQVKPPRPLPKKAKTAPVVPEEVRQAAQSGSAGNEAKPPAAAELQKKKKGFAFVWGKKRSKSVERETEETVKEVSSEAPAINAAAEPVKMEFPEDQTKYALILHQYSPQRESDLVLLIQQVGQMSEEKARKLLKVPALLRREVSASDARIAIEKFNQVQAQVKLITMEQLQEIQKRQAPPPSESTPKAASQVPPMPQARPVNAPTGSPGERYALILKSFDPAQRKPILELLASLSGRSVAQLQQSLKPPALILRDATKDEVTMIAQQFQNLSADVKSVTMAELQKLMAKK